MMKQEPEIIINGINVGPGCAMTIRVAIECFATNLHENGLGDDEHGKTMTMNYLNGINEVRRIMGLIPTSSMSEKNTEKI